LDNKIGLPKVAKLEKLSPDRSKKEKPVGPIYSRRTSQGEWDHITD